MTTEDKNRHSAHQARFDALTLMHQNREIEAAQAGYMELLELDPNDAELHYRLGLTQHQLDQEEDALASLERAIALNPADPRFFNLRGNVYHFLQSYSQSCSDYLRATLLDPEYALAFNNLGLSYKAQGRFDEAEQAFKTAIGIKPDYSDAYFNCAGAREAAGDILGAINALQRCLEINHADQEAMLRIAYLSGQQSDEAPARLITGMFDQYAATFDTHLQDELGYQTPTKLAELLRQHVGDQRFAQALDLGCGTGLAGMVLRNQVDRLSGVDLSPKMLEQAAEKAVYDELAQGELVGFLENSEARYDLFISSDVLVYVGDLAPLFQAMARRAMAGAWCLISTEINSESGYRLQPSARFAHNADYVESTAREFGFDLVERRQVPLRKDVEDWVQGNLFLLRRNPG